MDQIISITQARNSLSSIIDAVVQKGKRFILVRNSVPTAVIFPYEEALKDEVTKEETWKKQIKKAMRQSRYYFKKWLIKKGYDPKKLTEAEVLKIISEA